MKALRFLLYPFAVLYNVITTVRNYLFDIKVFKSASFDVPVIAVGNLNVGGTGKTPQIEYLIRLLKDTHQIAVLSRGYKRKTKGFIVVDDSHTASDVGDEPLQFFRKFHPDITVAVDVDRTHGIRELLGLSIEPNLILLDDAFQHRKVQAGYYILLTKYDDLYVDDYMLPTGNLRENKGGSRRADCIVVTKCPVTISKNEQNQITKKLLLEKNQEVFFTGINYDEHLKGVPSIHLEALQDTKILLVTGIASPLSLITYMNSKGIDFKHLEFPDHHHFSESDLKNIKTTFDTFNTESKLLLTTEKDYVRLYKHFPQLSYIAIRSEFISDESKFINNIKEFTRMQF